MRWNTMPPIPKPGKTKIRAFGGLDQTWDENDMSQSPTIYTKDGYGFDVDNLSLKAIVQKTFPLTTAGGSYATLPTGYAPYNVFLFDRYNSSGVRKIDLFCSAYLIATPTTIRIFNICLDGGTPTTWTDITGGLTIAAHMVDGVSYQLGETPYFILTNGADVYSAVGGGTTLTALAGNPPNGSIIELHKERVWIAGVAGLPDTLYYSNKLVPTDWVEEDQKAGFFMFPTWDGDKIIAIKSFGDSLLVWKQRSMWRIVGSIYDEFMIELVIDDIGAVNPNAVAIGEGICFFATSIGIFSFNGVEVKPYKTREIQDIYNSLDKSTLSLFWTNGYLYMYGFGADNKARHLKINTRTGDTTTCAPVASATKHISLFEHPLYPLQYVVAYNGKLTHVKEPLYPDNPGMIHMRFATPATDFGTSLTRKRISRLAITGKGGLFKITPVVDGVEKTPKTITLPTPAAGFTPKDCGVVWVPLSATGRRIAFILENVSSSPVEILDIEVERMGG